MATYPRREQPLKAFLIVGTQRTGTSAVAEQLGLHPEITCGWESTNRINALCKLAVAERFFAEDFRAVRPKERNYLERVHHPGKGALGFRRLFRASPRWVVSPAYAPALWLDRLEAHIAWLGRRHPEIRIIHITRTDNVAWLRSMGLARTSGQYVGTPYPKDATTRWPLRTALKRVQTKHWIGERLSSLRNTNPYINLGYEAFRQDNRREIGRLIAFLGLEPPTATNAAASIQPQSRANGHDSLVNAAELEAFLERHGVRSDPLR
jgi:hypothetical protein